ncbi:PP2C family protein-serine/threonine phosphatase [Micromonospora sp. WMMD882]|uniref:PP2C family protein-serine/threonine phosphatase n=1 Tax=Micromonospora sp. WMMD882 TaxID=3015151 RepID=UPI00248B4F83|nr:PP2C family protein-serine/threonine phosphatase [Micromonospora sp. WMMD882]WBB79514.1 PP2C family protein-serine/threonine phosphatase [Micromonospora sp. WMMD882]
MTTTREGGVTGPVSGDGHATRERSRPTPAGAAPTDATLARELLDGLAEAVVTADAQGVVTLVNAMAVELLPEVTPGTPLAGAPMPALAGAARAGADVFETEHRGRRLRGVRRTLKGPGHAWYVRDVTEERARTDALLAERSRTAFLARAGSRLGVSLHREQTQRTTVTLPVPYLADAALLVHRAPPPAPADAEPVWVRFADGDPGPLVGTGPAELADSVPGLAEALDGDRTDARPWLDAELADLGRLLPDGFGRPGTVLVTPVLGAGGPTGALILVRRAGRTGFDERDTDVAREFAARAGAALATAELYGEQTHLARVLQASLLPPRLPEIPGVALAGGYRAAGDSLRIGGDFYDVSATGDGGTFALGDVCGKGVGAAVLTGRVRQSIQTLRLVEQRPLELMALLNRALFDAPEATRRNQFTTLLLGAFAAGPDGGVTLRVAGGGHPSPLVVTAAGAVRTATVGGMPVGALSDARFVEVELRLAPGELLLAYTDGVTEARGGPGAIEMFGAGRLRRALASGAGLPPRAMVDRLLQLVDEWLDGQGHDDIAMLAIAAAPGG